MLFHLFIIILALTSSVIPAPGRRRCPLAFLSSSGPYLVRGTPYLFLSSYSSTTYFVRWDEPRRISLGPGGLPLQRTGSRLGGALRQRVDVNKPCTALTRTHPHHFDTSYNCTAYYWQRCLRYPQPPANQVPQGARNALQIKVLYRSGRATGGSSPGGVKRLALNWSAPRQADPQP